jgi:hypothetical protein
VRQNRLQQPIQPLELMLGQPVRIEPFQSASFVESHGRHARIIKFAGPADQPSGLAQGFWPAVGAVPLLI